MHHPTIWLRLPILTLAGTLGAAWGCALDVDDLEDQELRAGMFEPIDDGGWGEDGDGNNSSGNPGDDGGDNNNGPPPSCYDEPDGGFEPKCVDDPDPNVDDGCVCGEDATMTEQLTYAWCDGFFEIMPSPPSTNPCNYICKPTEGDDAQHELCMEACNAICVNDVCPDDLDIWGNVVEAVCCDISTGTNVPATSCADDHPIPENPSISCCNSWESGCMDCCSDYHGSAFAMCEKRCLKAVLAAGC